MGTSRGGISCASRGRLDVGIAPHPRGGLTTTQSKCGIELASVDQGWEEEEDEEEEEEEEEVHRGI